MSVGMYMNMEPLYLKIVRDHILKMTDENHSAILDEPIHKSSKKKDCKEHEAFKYLDDAKMLNNLENGFVVITQLECFIESFLNTILNTLLGYEEDDSFKKRIEEKLSIIFSSYEKDVVAIKSMHLWQVFKETRKMRDFFIHYKKTYIKDTMILQDLTMGDKDISAFFTKSNMEKLLNEHIALTELIAAELGLQINKEVKCFDSDGHDGPVHYVTDSRRVAYADNI